MILQALVEFFRLLDTILTNGGWILFALALFYMFYRLYMDHINIRWYHSQKWVFLKITAPQNNEKSPLAFEQIFNQLHSTHSTFTIGEKYVEGQFQIWFTWEMTSIGGVIGNYVRIIEKHRDTLEAAIYSQFPEAEVTETEDYFELLPKFDADRGDYKIYAYHMILRKEDAYPIRTYYDFEHAAAETMVDPVTGVWEELGKLNPYEMFVIQYFLRPVDDSWKVHGYALVNKLKGAPTGHTGPGWIVSAINVVVGFFLDLAIRAPAAEPTRREQEPPRSQMLFLTGGEKLALDAIERNLTKLGYETKINHLYIAPREKFNPSPVYTAVIGAYKSLTSSALNAIKPDTDTWTKPKYWLFGEWERPLLELRLKYRQRHFMRFMTRRWFFGGQPPYVLNTEEIATVLHFPQMDVTVPQIEKVPVKKVVPPPDLPIQL